MTPFLLLILSLMAIIAVVSSFQFDRNHFIRRNHETIHITAKQQQRVRGLVPERGYGGGDERGGEGGGSDAGYNPNYDDDAHFGDTETGGGGYGGGDGRVPGKESGQGSSGSHAGYGGSGSHAGYDPSAGHSGSSGGYGGSTAHSGYGGSTSHSGYEGGGGSGGSTAHSGYGGSTAHSGYGGSSEHSGYGGSTSHSSGGSTSHSSHGGTSSSTYGGSSYGGSSYGSTSSYGKSSSGGSHSSKGGYGSGGYGSSGYGHYKQRNPIKIQLGLALFLVTLFLLGGMLLTAYEFVQNPEGNYANCCRLTLNAITCMKKLLYNLYHCRLAEIPQVVCYLDENDMKEDDLERMKVRAGVERALDIEHKRAMDNVEMEMKSLKAPESSIMSIFR